MENLRWITECLTPERWQERILARVVINDHGCWIWTLSLDRHGYGRFQAVIDGLQRSTSAHRAAWLCICGPIPYPLMPDHLCRNRACCNPDHMEIVTNSVNTLRGDHSAKAGHSGRKPGSPRGCGTHGEMDGYWHVMADGYTRWVCRPCAKARAIRFRAKS